MANRKQTDQTPEQESGLDKTDKQNPIKILTGGTRDLRKYTHQI